MRVGECHQHTQGKTVTLERLWVSLTGVACTAYLSTHLDVGLRPHDTVAWSAYMWNDKTPRLRHASMLVGPKAQNAHDWDNGVL